MAVLLHCPWENAAEWQALLRERLNGRELRVYPDIGKRADIEVAVVWRPPADALADLPNLRLIQSLGAGVDHIDLETLADSSVPIARLVDPVMAARMAEYVLAAILRVQRQFHAYEQQQQVGQWLRWPHVDPGDVGVGVLGMGFLGRWTAKVLVRQGYRVAGWSRSRKAITGVESFCGPAELPAILGHSDYLVCLLPATPETRGLINRANLAHMPAGGYLINCARGEHLIEEDLLAALKSGQLAGATLDVFRDEPLPPGHPFWRHPKIFVTPHVSAISNPPSAVDQIVENIERLEQGLTPQHLMDRDSGY